MLNFITYILLDAARMGDQMDEAKKLNPVNDSLYRGGSEESLSAVAPYIFTFDVRLPFAAWYMTKGWGDSWGILLKSPLPIPELHRHFRKFLLVKTEDGEELYFRFYDPRVLRIFLPTCDESQIRELFGPVEYFLMEDEDPEYAIRFWHENGILKSKQFNKTELNPPVYIEPEISEDQETETTQPAEPEAPSVESTTLPSPSETNLPTEDTIKPQVKTKWNMFD